jgi:RHS repeat-associated protein
VGFGTRSASGGAGNLARGFVSANNGAATHYTYDMNGNMITDVNKNITSIEYNYLNLPQVITFSGNRIIQFIYDATGAKLRKISNNNGTITTYDYVGGVEYKNNVLERFANTEGSVVNNGSGGYEYEYVLRDHLGNTRVTFNGNADGTVTVNNIKQINHYYPFGMNTEGNWNGASGKNKYQYNGKELNEDFGLNWNDYGARFYDAAIGRWNVVDPLSERYLRWSGYNYTKGNPVKYIDPDGMQVQYDWNAHNRGQKGVYTEETATSKEKSSFSAAMAGVSKKDLTSTDTRTFGVDIKGADGKSGYISMTVWTPKTTVQNEGRPKGDDDDFLYSAGYYTNGGTEFNISAEFTQSGRDDIGDNQKESFLTAVIKISPNFTKETNATIGGTGSINTPVASVGVEASVGYTNTHTSGMQDFNVSWRVVEQYSGNKVRSSVNISTDPKKSSYGVTLQPNSNTYTTNVQFFGINHTVRVHLQID